DSSTIGSSRPSWTMEWNGIHRHLRHLTCRNFLRHTSGRTFHPRRRFTMNQAHIHVGSSMESRCEIRTLWTEADALPPGHHSLFLNLKVAF
ncbi:hypothetical protein AVEN_200409-1, partial [Araneus ventricosus]